MNDPIISLKNVSYLYPHADESDRPALSGITLDISHGEFVGLVGANGSGKSTLARLLNALVIPASGEVRIAGLLTNDRDNLDRVRETAGMVFQNPDSQIVATSVGDDIAFGLENIGLPPDQIETRVVAAAARFGISELLDREPHWLSGGQKQRTVLAGVVAIEPSLLILDEPTSMLDPASGRQFRQLVEELWRDGTTVIYISQLMDELVGADRLVALDEGQIAFDGEPVEFFATPDLLERTNLEAPLAARLSTALTGCQGGKLPLTIEQLVAEICA